MRLQTFSYRQGLYLAGTRLTFSPRRLLQRSGQRIPTVSKGGQCTVLLDRAHKPQCDKINFVHLNSPPKVHPRHVKHKWHVSKPGTQNSTARPRTKKPCTPAQVQQNLTVTPAPVLVPNRAFPFIKHAGEQAALGLHKPIGLVLASAYLLGVICHVSGVCSLCMPTLSALQRQNTTACLLFSNSIIALWSCAAMGMKLCIFDSVVWQKRIS